MGHTYHGEKEFLLPIVMLIKKNSIEDDAAFRQVGNLTYLGGGGGK
jgi:hypothetical protein